jgi:hypothetical protein
MAQAAPVKRSELQLVVAVVACVVLALIALMTRRYSAAAAMNATMKVEQHSSGVDTTGWVSVDGVKHPFTVSGPTNLTVSGRVLSFRIEKVAGTNDVEVSMFSSGRLIRREFSKSSVEGRIICPSPRMTGLKFWGPSPRISEHMTWQR